MFHEREGYVYEGKMGLNGQYSQEHIHGEPGAIKIKTGTNI